MPWIAFKNLKRVQVTYFVFLKLCPSFVCLSFALGCSKTAVSKAEHLRKWSTPVGRPKNLMGQVYEAQKFSLRKRRGFQKLERKKRENLTLKFSIVCCVLNWSFPPSFIGDKTYTKEENDSYLEWKIKETQILIPTHLGISVILKKISSSSETLILFPL